MVDLDYLKTYSEVQSTKIRWIYEMSNTRKKIASVLEWLIGIALALCLFLGGLGFIGFVVAFCMGGDSAAAICEFLSKTYYVYLIKASTVTVAFCFLLQYFDGNAKWVNPIRYWKNKAAKKK